MYMYTQQRFIKHICRICTSTGRRRQRSIGDFIFIDLSPQRSPIIRVSCRKKPAILGILCVECALSQGGEEA